MSDKDLIKRGDVLKEAVYLNVDTDEMVVFVQDIKEIPAVTHEMSAREFLRDFHRLCQSMRCDECPITHDGEPRTCAVLMGCFPDETIETVEQWAREHTEDMCGCEDRNEQ